MDQDIQECVVRQCIKAPKVGKRLDPDSFTALYYRKLVDVLAYPLTAINGLNFSSDLLTANIVMLPKPDRDYSSWANFQTMSLINIDMKSLPKYWLAV